MNKILKKENGQAIIEVLLAVAIFATSSIVIALVLVDALKTNKASQEENSNVFQAERYLSALDSIADSDWIALVDNTDVPNLTLQENNNQWKLVQDSGSQLQLNISSVYRGSNGKGDIVDSSDVGATLVENSKMVTLEITSLDAYGNSQVYKLERLFTLNQGGYIAESGTTDFNDGTFFDTHVIDQGIELAFADNTEITHGEYISSNLDIGLSNVEISLVSLGANIPVDTSLKYQIRTADTESHLQNANWIGPDKTVNTFFMPNESQAFHSEELYPSTRWVQYKIYFYTEGSELTARVDNFELFYQ